MVRGSTRILTNFYYDTNFILFQIDIMCYRLQAMDFSSLQTEIQK